VLFFGSMTLFQGVCRFPCVRRGDARKFKKGASVGRAQGLPAGAGARRLFPSLPPALHACTLTNTGCGSHEFARNAALQTVKHVHPDKLASSSVRERLLGSMVCHLDLQHCISVHLCSQVFNLLNEAFIAFKSREGI